MLAIITGSGFYGFDDLHDVELKTVDTPWGQVSVTAARWQGTTPVLFLPRHGEQHSVAPHLINYRANLSALQKLGASAIVATAVSGGIADDLDSGSLVAIDDFIDLTSGRPTTFFDEPGTVQHTDVSEPYDPGLRRLLLEAGSACGLTVRDGGVYCATNGPRFETRAEIAMMRAVGGELVGMTGCPEVVLANELAIPYAALGVISNRAVGLASVELSLDEIWRVLEQAKPRVQAIVGHVLDHYSVDKHTDRS